MDKMLSTSVFFGVFVSIAGYEIGLLLKRKFKLALFNPLLIAIVVVMVILAGTGVDYESYNEGAKYLSYLLTPATVCLAVPLYQQLSMLKSNYKAICGGIVAGVLTSILSVLGLCVICGFDHQMYGDTASEVDHNCDRYGRVGRAWRPCHGYRGSDHHYRCIWKYHWGGSV